MLGLDPSIHDFFQFQDVDARHKAGHDDHSNKLAPQSTTPQ
jgi:hypothetical protein